MPINAFLSKQYPYVSPESSSAAIHVSSEDSEPEFEYPTTFPARAFMSEEVMNLPHWHSAAIHVSSEDSEPELEYPNTFPARPFNSEEAMNLPRVSLQETELIQYQRCPELLEKETFVSFNEDEEYEAFRIPMFITAGQKRIFYVVYGGEEAPEMYAFDSIHLFELLGTSERVLRN
jgi:hypothetical protein